LINEDIRELLLAGEKRIGLWGTGFIGYSSMAHFARNGVRCYGTDVMKDKIEALNKGEIAIPNIEYWLGFDVKPFAERGLMGGTLEWRELLTEETPVHLVCIPTEKGGAPYDDILIQVFNNICSDPQRIKKLRPLVIIESTVTPNRVDDVVIPLIQKKGIEVGKDLLLGVAPRRDWFVSPEKNLVTLPRVVGGTTPETTDLMEQVLGIVCGTVLKATDHKHAALVKSIENAYRHLDITFANQLTAAYPHINMKEVLQLVGTKWNIGTFHPSFGTGGYCIPLAPQYVIMGAEKPDELGLVHEAIKFDSAMPERVVERVAKAGFKKVGILGLAYKGDIKVDILSPTAKLVPGLKAKGIDVKVNDPYYTDAEVKQIVDAKTFRFPDDLGQFDAILLVADHMLYKATPKKKILEKLEKCKLILDNTGIWKGLNPPGVEYHEAGEADWL